MKILKILLIGFALLGLTAYAESGDSVKIRVQLIQADQSTEASDPALSKLLPKLKRMPYKRFRLAGSKTINLSSEKKAKAAIAGHTIQLQLESVKERRARVHVNWKRGKTSVVKITATAQPGSPFVCGGPREGDQTWIAVFSVQ